MSGSRRFGRLVGTTIACGLIVLVALGLVEAYDPPDRVEPQGEILGGVIRTSTIAAFQEKGTIVKPVPRVLTVSEFRIQEFQILFEPLLTLRIVALDNNDLAVEDIHVGRADQQTNPRGADVVISELNRADNRANSLEKRLLEHLASENVIPPVLVTGKPR